jgi:serine protease Do
MIQAQSSGSGFFISADGDILTNNHVIEDANAVQVVLSDGRRLPARLVGRDPASDLAVLKVEGRNFPHVTFATAANPRVGEAVIAIGNPFGLGSTATHGIVSAYARDIGSPYVDFVQLDAPINQGNSGGPTFNGRGEVIGVNTAIFSTTGGSVGIGFAIPAAVARDVSRQLIADGRVMRGFIGASVGDLPPQKGALTPQGGAVIAAVAAGAPAARAGLLPGDVVVAADGAAVTGAADLIRRVVQAPAGRAVTLEVLRGDRRLRLSVTPEQRATDAS